MAVSCLFLWLIFQFNKLILASSDEFYERQHNEFIMLNTTQIWNLPHINENVSNFPIIPFAEIKNSVQSNYFNRLNHKIAKQIHAATISIISIYKKNNK